MKFKQIIEGPEPDDPLEEWEAFLAELLADPDQDDVGVATAIRFARLEIELRKGRASA